MSRLLVSDREAYIRSVLRVRRFWKVWGLPMFSAFVGMACFLLFDFSPLNSLLNLGGSALLLFDELDNWLRVQPIARAIAAPAVFVVFARAFVSWPRIRNFLDRVFPDPPSFVFGDLELERKNTMLELEQDPVSFCGRELEKAELAKLLKVVGTPNAFGWRMLSGPSGVGKTRLAVEWLGLAKAAKWDFGFLNPYDTAAISHWKPRRHTAFVIDEADSQWGAGLADIMALLQRSASEKTVVRVLLISQLPFFALRAAPASLNETEASPPMVLMPFDDDLMYTMVSEFADMDEVEQIVKASAGRPRAAFIIARFGSTKSYVEAMNEWVYQLFPELRHPGQKPTVGSTTTALISGLAAPLETASALAAFPECSFSDLARLFPGQGFEKLNVRIEPLAPDDLAQNVVLKLLPTLNPSVRTQIIEFCLAQNPERVAQILEGIWCHIVQGPSSEYLSASELDSLFSLQTAFDNAYHDYGQQVAASIEGLIQEALDEHDPEMMKLAMDRIDRLIAARAFDRALYTILNPLIEKQFQRIMRANIDDLSEFDLSTCLYIEKWVTHSHFIDGNADCFHVKNVTAMRMRVEAVLFHRESDYDKSRALADHVASTMQGDINRIKGSLLSLSIALCFSSRATINNGAEELGETFAQRAFDLYQMIKSSQEYEDIMSNFAGDIVFSYLHMTLCDSACMEAAVRGNLPVFLRWKERADNMARTEGLEKFYSANIYKNLMPVRMLMCSRLAGDRYLADDVMTQFEKTMRSRKSVKSELDVIHVVKELRYAIHILGERAYFADVEQLGEIMFALIYGKWVHRSSAARLEAAYSCACAIQHYRERFAADSGAVQTWLKRLAKLSPEFEDNVHLQGKVVACFGYANPNAPMWD